MLVEARVQEEIHQIFPKFIIYGNCEIIMIHDVKRSQTLHKVISFSFMLNCTQ